MRTYLVTLEYPAPEGTTRQYEVIVAADEADLGRQLAGTPCAVLCKAQDITGQVDVTAAVASAMWQAESDGYFAPRVTSWPSFADDGRA